MTNYRRNGRRMHGSDPLNCHFCAAGGSAIAASAAAGSRMTAAAFSAMPLQRIRGSIPPKLCQLCSKGGYDE
ncbi:MAG: hypothetical protein H0X30_03465 [Anaerolineae bacterium]|nr:hypothetical protein [Anaerolineae bacterium]